MRIKAIKRTSFNVFIWLKQQSPFAAKMFGEYNNQQQKLWLSKLTSNNLMQLGPLTCKILSELYYFPVVVSEIWLWQDN